MNIRIRRHERSRRRLRQQNRISLHLPERTGLNSEEDHVVLANGPFSHQKSTHTYTEHTTLTSVAVCVIVNHQKPKFLVNIANKTATYVRGTHRPAAHPGHAGIERGEDTHSHTPTGLIGRANVCLWTVGLMMVIKSKLNPAGHVPPVQLWTITSV